MKPPNLLKSLFASSVLSAGISSFLPAEAFNIQINAGSSLASNTQALAAFNRAATNWSSRFSDNITVNISADLNNTFANPNIIGSTGSVSLFAPYDQVRNAIAADRNGIGDSIVAFLPTFAQFTSFVPAGFTIDPNITASKANFKALGFTGLDARFGTNDATITFNSAFSFDFDNRDGVSSGTVDFETVAAHELGHALGFLSSVDSTDSVVSGAIRITPLDLFRFSSSNQPTTAAQFTNLQRELRPGSAASFSDTVNSLGFSTGVARGDGRQASHWQDDDLTGNYIGILDPTLANGVVEAITQNDLQAFNLIGYDLVAVPFEFSPTMGLVFLGTLRFAYMLKSEQKKSVFAKKK